MMKHYKSLVSKVMGLVVLVSFGFASSVLNAQLSGSYTIDNTKSTSGSNFQTWSAFVSALNGSGVSGAVSVKVMNDETITSSLTLSAISGASSTNTIAIDGNIYVLSDDGSIQKIFRGTKVDYDFRELPSTPFTGQNLKIKTSPELDFLYILDPDNQRILVFTKGDRFATYKKQVLFEVTDARDFVIDDSGQKVNVLTKDKIYEFSL